jgi:hypothetical protein
MFLLLVRPSFPLHHRATLIGFSGPQEILGVLGIIGSISAVLPVFLIAAVFITLIYWGAFYSCYSQDFVRSDALRAGIGYVYLASSRELKRHGQFRLSPVQRVGTDGVRTDSVTKSFVVTLTDSDDQQLIEAFLQTHLWTFRRVAERSCPSLRLCFDWTRHLTFKLISGDHSRLRRLGPLHQAGLLPDQHQQPTVRSPSPPHMPH